MIEKAESPTEKKKKKKAYNVGSYPMPREKKSGDFAANNRIKEHQNNLRERARRIDVCRLNKYTLFCLPSRKGIREGRIGKLND